MTALSPAPNVEVIACPLCGSSRSCPERSGPDYLLGLPGVFYLVRCAECDLVYQNPRMPLTEIARYYPDVYGSYGLAVAGLAARTGLLGRIIRRGLHKRCRLLDRTVRPLPPRPRRLLDVGSASGIFLEAMQSYAGWELEGVEVNASAAGTTSARLGVRVFAGPFEHAGYPDASFDAVTMWDVLEHLHDPLAALREVRRILRPSGALFVRVPNANGYVARICGRYWVGYDLPRHMTVFTATTLLRSLEEAGFAPPLRTYWSASYLALLHSLRFALGDRGVSAERADAIHGLLLHPVARAIAWLPFTLADRVAQGSALEVLALARAR